MVKKCVVVIKKFLKIVVFVILGLAVLQIIRFAVESHAFDTSDLKKAVGNYLQRSECNIGNCVLVHKKNGISTFPFVFGNRLYLYDIERKKHKLVAGTWLPFTEIGTLVTLADNKVYYYKEGIGEEFREYEDYGIVFVTDLSSREEDVFMDGEVQYFRILENIMYCCNQQDGKLHAVNLDTGERKSYECAGKGVGSLIPGEGKEVLADVYSTANPDNEDSLGLLRLNTEEGTETIEDSKTGEWIAHYRDGAIYTEDEFCIYKYDRRTWVKEMIIDIREEMPFLNEEEYKSNVWSEISYCDDYIAMEICYHSDKGGDRSELLVHDYNGELVHREELY